MKDKDFDFINHRVVQENLKMGLKFIGSGPTLIECKKLNLKI